MRYRKGDGRAMEQPRQTELTADEFIAWALEQATGRFELDNGTVVADRFVELISPFVDVKVTDALRLDLTIAVRIADSLTRYAFERDPAGDREVLDETKRVVRAHLSRALGEPEDQSA